MSNDAKTKEKIGNADTDIPKYRYLQGLHGNQQNAKTSFQDTDNLERSFNKK